VTEDKRSKKSADLVAEALAAKKRYVTLDLVIPDGDLKTHVERYGPEGERLLTLEAVLLFDGFGGLASQILRSLEANLAHFHPRLDEKKSKHLADNLLNGRDQFLNTLSELGLARRLSMQGMTIDLAQPFHDGSRDVDVADSTKGSERFIEVVNLAPVKTTVNGFAPDISEEVKRLVTTVTGKYQSKFGKAIAEGWDGPMWIALDIIKNDMAAISATIGSLREPDFLSSFALAVLRSCPKLHGILYYTHYAYEEAAFWLKEFHR